MVIPAFPVIETVDYLPERSMTFLKLCKTNIIYVLTPIYNIIYFSHGIISSCALIPDRCSDKDNICDVKVINVALRNTIVKKLNGIMGWRFYLSSIEN